MPHDQRTPVVPARRLDATTAQVGDRIAVTLDQGTYPFEVVGSVLGGDQVVLSLREIPTLHTAEPREVEVGIAPDQQLAALAAHYGTCHDCGRLSPCPDELAERRLEQLWHDTSAGGATAPAHREADADPEGQAPPDPLPGPRGGGASAAPRTPSSRGAAPSPATRRVAAS